MDRIYIALGALLVGLFGYGQYQHWSIFGSDVDHTPRSQFSSSGPRHK